jgi:hypothetical protein
VDILVKLDAMIIELLEMVRSWPVVGQFFFIIIIASFLTAIVLALITTVGDFLTNGIANIFHGHPEQNSEETEDEQT